MSAGIFARVIPPQEFALGLSQLGTDGSNPSPSSGQSVSLPQPLSSVENPGFPRGCARLASARDAQAFPLRANRRVYLCRATFQYRSASNGVGDNATTVRTKSGVAGA